MHHGCFAQEPRPPGGRASSPSAHRQDGAIATEVAYILDEIRIEVDRSPEGARAAALRLVALLTPHALASADARGGLAPWQKRNVDRHLREHLGRPLLIKELAEQVSLSVSHFCRAFKDSFGTTPHAHIVRLRVERAKELMLETRDSLSDIALSCGLADQAHLSKVFRRWMGEPPNAWRRRNIVDPQGARRLRPASESRAASPRLAA